MKPASLVPTTLLAFAISFAPLTFAQPTATPPTDGEIIAKARETYPLKNCVVSGEALGKLEEAAGYIHRAAGKPDRVVFFCCEGCTDDFKADPAKFLKKVDDAAKAKPAADKKSEDKPAPKYPR